MAERDDFTGSDTPTPPRGMPVVDPNAELDTPPEGIGLGDLINAEDVGTAAPSVLGASEPRADRGGEAGDWPSLQRRERDERPRRMGFFRRNQSSVMSQVSVNCGLPGRSAHRTVLSSVGSGST